MANIESMTPSGEPLNNPLITGKPTYRSLGDRISALILYQRTHPYAWMITLAFGFLLLNLFFVSMTWLLYKGVGVWGINIPSAWGFDIINFVWWIGIGHAGTLISAILLLLKQKWRNSINRFAEAMTIFAVMCAGIYPLFHTGRPWVACYWLLPLGPNILGMWPQFRSPLMWDVFAVSTYFTISLVFWYMGMIPDFATLRDKAESRTVKIIFGLLSLGWRGGHKHWHRYETANLILAGLSAPLVLSVHTIVSFDFAVGIVPGWHTTIFPPYFVAGAVYAGFAMVLTVAIPIRAWYGLKDMITMRHLDWMAKVMLTTGLIVFYGYILEVFYGWFSGNQFEWAMILNRFKGPYAVGYWALIFCNGIVPQFLWAPKIRQNIMLLWIISQIVSVGMWLERYIIIPVSLTRDYLPSSWGYFTPSVWDFGLFVGTIGLFIFLMFLFIRFVPIINMYEMKELLHSMLHESHDHQSAHVSSEDEPASSGSPPLLGAEGS